MKQRTCNYWRAQQNQPKRPLYQFTASKGRAYATSLGVNFVHQNALGIWWTLFCSALRKQLSFCPNVIPIQSALPTATCRAGLYFECTSLFLVIFQKQGKVFKIGGKMSTYQLVIHNNKVLSWRHALTCWGIWPEETLHLWNQRLKLNT